MRKLLLLITPLLWRSRTRLLILLLAYAGWSSAATWKIGPNGNFTDINAAMNSASVKDGDVLRIMDNATIGSSSTSQTVTKSVTIEGPGIVVDNNGNVETASYIASDLYLQETGIVISKLYLTGTVYVRADEITVEKCWIKAEINGAQQNYDTEDFTLRQCYLQNCSVRGLNSEDHPGWRIMNNIFAYSSTSSNLTFVLSSMYDAVIDHNIFYVMYQAGYSADYIMKFVEDCTIINNIITKFVLNSDNTISAVSDKILRDDLFNSNTITNNVFTGTMSKANNKGGISSFTDVYTGKLLEGLKYPETQYMLSANSLANGYATDGSNCGPWDGQYPYLLGGLKEPKVTPPTPMKGTFTLDATKTDNPASGVYQSLLSLFTDMGSRGVGGDLIINVANNTYSFTITDATLPILQAMAMAVLSTNYGIQMNSEKKSGNAVLNFSASSEFLMAHASELSSLQATITQLFQRIALKNITVQFNGITIISESEFQVEANDLLALKNMYNAFGGANWTKKKWSFASNGKSKEDFPGVTFNDQGRVTAIDLQENGLDGEMFDVYSPSFAELTSLNLSYNKLRGDISKFVINLPKLQTLNMYYNRITEVSKGLPTACTSINLQCQNRPWGVSGNYVTDNFYSLSPIKYTVRMDNYDYVNIPSLFTFGKTNCSINTANGNAFGNYVAMMHLRNTDNYLRFYPTDNKIIYTLPQDTICIFWQTGSSVTVNSAYPIKMHFAPGDADMNGVTNVLDVQYTLTYILASNTITVFNYSAANTYSDNLINVQDIVATVNIMLGNTSAVRSANVGAGPVPARPEASEVPSSVEGTVFSRDGQLMLTAERPVAAIDVELEGVSTDEVGLMLSSRDFQMIGRNTEWGSRYVIFSPTGKSIPANTETPLLRLASYAQPVSIMCSDPEAKSVGIAISIGDGVTQIVNSKSAVGADSRVCPIFDLQGRQIVNSKSVNRKLPRGLYIQNGKKVIFQ